MTNPPDSSSASSSSRGLLIVLLVVLVGGGMYFLGRSSHAVAQNPPPGEGQTAQKTLDDAGGQASPSPANANAPGDKTPGGRHLAPHDTFYLLRYASVKTPTGVIGFEPGQEVHLVEVHQPSRTLVVGDDRAQVEVGPEMLTNDLDIAALVRQKDQANQAKIAAYIQQEQKAYEDSKREAAAKTEQELEKIDEHKQAELAANNDAARNNSPGTGVNAPTKLDEPPVTVGGGTGYAYGSAGSAYYGSPYSYFGGGTVSTGTTTAPANTGAAGGGGAGGGGRAGNPANVGH